MSTHNKLPSKRRYFGTDGIRGHVGTHPITADFMLKLGWASGQVLTVGDPKGKVLIGKDTRLSGYMFESVLEAGFVSCGVDVSLLGPMPTPAIAYLTRTLGASASVVISASHNAYTDNGIKFFNAHGMKISTETESQIEALLEFPMRTVATEKIGRANRIGDASGRYIEFCKRTVPFGLSLKGLRIVVDCANGATYHIAPLVFKEMGAEIIQIGCNPNGININDGVGVTNMVKLQQTVGEWRADLGVAFDGDGDRVLMVDANGQILDGNSMLFIIALSHRRQKRLNGDVVGTVMSNAGLEQALAKHGIGLQRSAVGDRCVLEQMQAHGSSVGGEPSGHIICADRVTTGDGIVAALQVLNEMQISGKPLAELCSGVSLYPQVLRDLPWLCDTDPMEIEALKSAYQRINTILADRGRILVRRSGTEKKLRVMIETGNAEEAQSLADNFSSCVSQVCTN